MQYFKRASGFLSTLTLMWLVAALKLKSIFQANDTAREGLPTGIYLFAVGLALTLGIPAWRLRQKRAMFSAGIARITCFLIFVAGAMVLIFLKKESLLPSSSLTLWRLFTVIGMGLSVAVMYYIGKGYKETRPDKSAKPNQPEPAGSPPTDDG